MPHNAASVARAGKWPDASEADRAPSIHRSGGHMAKRIILIVLGSFVLLIGLAVAVGGGALLVVFGTDGKASSDSNQIATSQLALVASVNDIQDTHGFATVVGRPTLQLT